MNTRSGSAWRIVVVTMALCGILIASAVFWILPNWHPMIAVKYAFLSRPLVNAYAWNPDVRADIWGIIKADPAKSRMLIDGLLNSHDISINQNGITLLCDKYVDGYSSRIIELYRRDKSSSWRGIYLTLLSANGRNDRLAKDFIFNEAKNVVNWKQRPPIGDPAYSDWELQASLINALGYFNSDATVEFLLSIAADNRHPMQSESISALGNTNSKMAFEFLCRQILQDDKNRHTYRQALNKYGDIAAVQVLQQAYRGEVREWEIQETNDVIAHLREMQEDSAKVPLIQSGSPK